VLPQTAQLSTALVIIQVALKQHVEQHSQHLLAVIHANLDAYPPNAMEPTAHKLNASMLVITLLLVLFQTALLPTAQKVASAVTVIHKLHTTLLVH
jgi:hypothetical protein